MTSNPSGSHVSGMRQIGHDQVAKTQSGSDRLEVTVLRAQSLPRLKTLGRNTRFYVTVTDGARIWQTRSVQSVGNYVEWNENVDTSVLPLSRVTISLYARRITQKDKLIGRQEITCEPSPELEINFGSAERLASRPTEPATVLTITLSANASSSLAATADTSNPPVDNHVTEGGVTRPIVESNVDTAQPTAVTVPASHLSKTGNPVASLAGRQTEISPTVDRAVDDTDTVKVWKAAINNINWVMKTVNPIVKLDASSALSRLSKTPETLGDQFQRDENAKTLLEAIREAFEFGNEADVLRKIEPGSVPAKTLNRMLQCITDCANVIESSAFMGRVGKQAPKTGQVDANVEHYCNTLVGLREAFRVAVSTDTAVPQTRYDVTTQESEMSDEALETELGAIIGESLLGGWRFDDRKGCLRGTREHFLDRISQWIENPGSQRGLVLFGKAGTGKSSIAHEIARHFDVKCLGSYVAFRRTENSKDVGCRLFAKLAHDLSVRYPPFKRALKRAMAGDSSLRGTRDYPRLFERLLRKPLENLRLGDTILVIIDGLDESGLTIGKKGPHSFLAQRLIELPPNFRVLITSRPEHVIETTFANAESVDTLYMDDAQLAADTMQDISLYLQDELPDDVFKSHGGRLMESSEGFFQWAAVACGFINSTRLDLGDNECVQRLLGHSRGLSGQGLLDNLYEQVLKEYFKTDSSQDLFRSVMGQLFAAMEPLSIDSLITLRRHSLAAHPEDSDRVLIMLPYLGSLLSNVISSDRTRPILPIHTSFRDFLTSRTSTEFYVDLADAHGQLVHSCLGIMLDNLKFNICKLESSYLANRDVPDLETRIAKHIPSALSYACIHWNNHLEHVAFDEDIFKKIRSVFETRFLFWLEVLSIKSHLGLASRGLSSLLIWLQREGSKTEVKNLLELANDASSFVRYFGMAIGRSVPHIYVSALPFAPTSSRIRNQYISRFPRTLRLERGQLSHWPALEMTIKSHGWLAYAFSPEKRIAFSPDGQRIASASEDCTIVVWDATTGQVVAGPFAGNTDSVTSIAFSPDGHRITSASKDGMVRMWDATTGQVVAGPFTGHTHSVSSIVFSPDGLRIASASDDGTIRVWDATAGHVVAGPFTGHTKLVTSVALSLDWQRIASASDDGTIRVWDATTGDVMAGPFTRTVGSVRSIAFSPDGQRIAAGDLCTIRVWDATTGQAVAGPFTVPGLASSVTSVAFYPDGQRIASVSDDNTIQVWNATQGQVLAGPSAEHSYSVLAVAFSPDGQRISSASSFFEILVWNATTGQVVAEPFPGFIDVVGSVAFSLDGQRIASASSFDQTIQVWDATTGQVVGGPFTGHTDVVTSIALSPDGQRITSASEDRTIRVWDATTGQVAASPFTGHTDWVEFVAFSPDGQRIASASYDDTIRVWDATRGQVMACLFTDDEHTGPVESVAFSPDGQHIASASLDCTIRVWDVTSGEVVMGPFTGHTGWVRSVVFSPDGQRIASASEDFTIRVWDARTGQVVAGPFTGHTGSIESVAFSPDGQFIASASRDCTIRLWDTTGQVAAGPYTAHTYPASSVAFSPDVQHAASASDDVVKIVTEDIKIHFTDQTLINDDGWIYGDEGKLILWIPEPHRLCLHRPSTIWISGDHETRLDLSKFVYGPNWTIVRD